MGELKPTAIRIKMVLGKYLGVSSSVGVGVPCYFQEK